MFSTLLFCLKMQKSDGLALRYFKFSNNEESNNHLGTLTVENTCKLYNILLTYDLLLEADALLTRL